MAISEGLIADDQPSALQALHQTVCRVDLLSEAVGKLNFNLNFGEGGGGMASMMAAGAAGGGDFAGL